MIMKPNYTNKHSDWSCRKAHHAYLKNAYYKRSPKGDFANAEHYKKYTRAKRRKNSLRNSWDDWIPSRWVVTSWKDKTKKKKQYLQSGVMVAWRFVSALVQVQPLTLGPEKLFLTRNQTCDMVYEKWRFIDD